MFRKTCSMVLIISLLAMVFSFSFADGYHLDKTVTSSIAGDISNTVTIAGALALAVATWGGSAAVSGATAGNYATVAGALILVYGAAGFYNAYYESKFYCDDFGISWKIETDWYSDVKYDNYIGSTSDSFLVY